MNRVCTLVVLVLAAASPVLADTAYVTDKVYVDIRADAAYESPVVHKLLAGTALEVLEQGPDFTRVRDHQGRVGWIENRELTRTLPPQARVTKLKRELNRVRTLLMNSDERLRAAEEAMAQDTLEEERVVKAQTKLKRQLAGERAKFAKAESELTKTRASLAKTEAELKEAQTALTAERAKATGLAGQLAEKVATENQPTDAAETPEVLAAHAQPSEEVPGSGDELQLALVTKPTRFERFLLFLQSLNFLWLAISFAMLVIGFAAGAAWLREKNRRKLGGMYLRI
ncbi:MAG: TIGR04211 family SH3 domain-containing protein [Acidiferrobacterales bacterium]